MPLISLSSTVALTGKSERTLWRLVSSGGLQREVVQGKAMFELDSLREFLPAPADVDDFPALIERADSGDAHAQADLALVLLRIFRDTGRHGEAAHYWLQLACDQGCTDAMNWLGYCHLQGIGVEQHEELGVMWISRAAALGHEISRTQMAALLDLPRAQDTADTATA